MHICVAWRCGLRVYSPASAVLHIDVARSGAGKRRLEGLVPTSIGAFAVQHGRMGALGLAGVSPGTLGGRERSAGTLGVRERRRAER